MPTVAEPQWSQDDEAPGPLPVDHSPPAPALSIDEELLLSSLMAALQRVVTEAGSGDRAWLRDVRGLRPSILSTKQRTHMMRLAWRYRFQLPPGLRPGADPDKSTEPRTN